MSNALVSDADVEKALPSTFLDKVMPEPNSGCWLWTGAMNTTGYGTYWSGGKCHTAHRFLYETVFGPQPGLEIDHLCRLPCCVNPRHLEAVTVAENNSRRIGLGKGNRKKTHCINGHEFSIDNVTIIVTKEGHIKRKCILCRNVIQRAYYARKKKL